MPKLLSPSLKIIPFRNPSGSIVLRLTGTIGGERLKKNFPSRTEAEAELARRLQNSTTVRPLGSILTRMSESQARDAEFALQRLPAGATLALAVDFFASHFRPLVPLAWLEAINRFEQHLTSERKTKPETAAARAGELRPFARFAGEQKIAQTDQLRPEHAKAWIYAASIEARTQRDRYDHLKQFCAWLVREKHAAINPVLELVRPKVRVDVPSIFTPIEAKALLDAAWTDPEGPQMLPHFAICLLSGVRPGECIQLQPSDLFLDGPHPIIEINKAKGGRSRRNVEIGPELLPILQRCCKLKLPPGFFSKRKFDRVRRAAGVFDRWEKDIERHTYASYCYQRARDLDGLAKNMGNSAKVLFTSYVRAVPHADALAFAQLSVDWQAMRRKTAEGHRVDLWAKQAAETLSQEQLAAVKRWRREAHASCM
jgi:integrase